MGSPVTISLLTPRWRPEAATWPRCWPVTPRWSYFHASDDEFDRQYVAQLDRHGPQEITRRLAQIAKTAYMEPSDRLVLLCWEADPDRCHRGTFARWLLQRTGELVTEA